MSRDSKASRCCTSVRSSASKAGPDFLQRVNEPGHFVGPDPPVQRQADRAWPSPPAPRQACPAPSHYEGVAPRLLVCGSMTSDRFIGGEPSITQFVLTGSASSCSIAKWSAWSSEAEAEPCRMAVRPITVRSRLSIRHRSIRPRSRRPRPAARPSNKARRPRIRSSAMKCGPCAISFLVRASSSRASSSFRRRSSRSSISEGGATMSREQALQTRTPASDRTRKTDTSLQEPRSRSKLIPQGATLSLKIFVRLAVSLRVGLYRIPRQRSDHVYPFTAI